jgi:hypothetical protein
VLIFEWGTIRVQFFLKEKDYFRETIWKTFSLIKSIIFHCSLLDFEFIERFMQENILPQLSNTLIRWMWWDPRVNLHIGWRKSLFWVEKHEYFYHILTSDATSVTTDKEIRIILICKSNVGKSCFKVLQLSWIKKLNFSQIMKKTIYLSPRMW